MRVGLLHPGEMGAFVGSAMAGHEVTWASEGRSESTLARAAAFTDVRSMAELVGGAEAIVSLCPPDHAVKVAKAVQAVGFRGLYLDANAVSPATVGHIAGLLADARVVDGAIIGGPSSDDAVLYLSGQHAAEAAALFDPGVLRTIEMAGVAGSASSLKAAYALSSKAVSAALLSARAAARAAGVEEDLLREWARTDPGLVKRTDGILSRVHRKAWRFVGEMNEAADFFDIYGVPSGFSRAAAETYARLADLRDRTEVSPDDVMDRIAPRRSAEGADRAVRHTPAVRIRGEAATVGAAELARRCGEVLATGECDDDLLLVLGGPGALFVCEEHHVDQSYWMPTWALRALLYVWDESVAPHVVAAFDHGHWRVREMAAKVAAKREIGAAGDALASRATDDTPRVRAAAARALGVVGEAEHADAVRLLLDDQDGAVRARAATARDLMQQRLDRQLDDD